jgi:hypothetical protein
MAIPTVRSKNRALWPSLGNMLTQLVRKVLDIYSLYKAHYYISLTMYSQCSTNLD